MMVALLMAAPSSSSHFSTTPKCRSPVRRLALALAVERFEAGVRPDEKVARRAALAATGRRVFMVGTA